MRFGGDLGSGRWGVSFEEASGLKVDIPIFDPSSCHYVSAALSLPLVALVWSQWRELGGPGSHWSGPGTTTP